ncbi:MAG TPA: Rieske (2Fe-2S) protein [Bacteroidota bacterium]
MIRRDFIRQSCTWCLMAGSGMLAGALESCATLSVYPAPVTDGTVTVPVSLFANASLVLVRPGQFLFDLALEKRPDGSFAALLLRCTHASNPVTFNGEQFTCSLHGSKFNEHGAVVRGPASLPLQQLPVRKTDGELLIDLPRER